MKWLEETRSKEFELVRHYLRHMFDGEWSSAPTQWKQAAMGALALLLPAGLLLIREGAIDAKYASKYRILTEAAIPGGLQAAAIADEIALITMLLSVTGLIALLVWQSLFPSGRDYLALASLPVRSRQIFAARFMSVLIFSAAIVTAMNLLPSLIAPVEFGGAWRIDTVYFQRAGAQALASGVGCFFVFFAIVALQGVLLNIVPAGLFVRVSVWVQGALAGVFVLCGLYGWSIKDWKPDMIARLPEFGAWLPPVWFAGLNQTLTGKSNAFYNGMALRAQIAAGFVVTLALFTYLISYRRHRKLLLEAPARLATPRVWRWSMLRLLARSPRREAVMDFMAKTLARSRTHRLLWLVYLGGAGAVLLNSSLLNSAVFRESSTWSMALRFVVHFWPLTASIVVLNGLRHVLSIPAELPANWVFRITESQGRAEWMSAVERFAITYAIAPIYLPIFPLAGIVLGWPIAIRMTILELLVSLSLFETFFYSWQKLPFTCSHVPGERPLIAVLAKYLGMLGVAAPILSFMIAVASQVSFLFPIYLVLFGGAWIWARRRRREGWGEAKLMYEDLPAVVTDLGLKELTYAGTKAQLRRIAAGDAGHADSEDPDPWSDARVRGSGVHPADLRGCAESGGGGAVPGAAPAGTERPAHVGVGRLGEQPARQVLPAHGSGTEAFGRGDYPMAQNVGGNRPNHGARLTALPFGETLTNMWLKLRTVLRRRQLDRDLEDELQFHLAMREEKLRQTGSADPSNRARRQFGNVSLFKERCRDLWTFGWTEALWQDIRFGFRQLRVNRGFAVVVAATLSVGVAATTTIYGICAALVWPTLPLPNPNSLVMVLEAFPGNPHLWMPSSPGDIEDIRTSDTLLAGLASWENATANIVDISGEPLRVDQARVTQNFFDVLGVAPALGRGFAPDDDQSGREREVVLSDRLWRSRFQADGSILGRTIRLNHQDYTVVGIMPPKFAFPRASKELWTRLTLTPEERNARNAPRIDSIGRLKTGHTLEQLQSELDALALRLEKLYPNTNAKRRFMAWTAHRYVEGDYAAQFARMLLGAALFVLLIACVNVASLQFAKGTARWREVAVRQALGASRGRIVTQLVTESIVLAFTGAALGIVLAWFGLRAIRDGMPAELQRYSSGWANLGINSGVLMFALAAAVLSGIVAGLAPALRSSHPNLTDSLKEGGHSSAGPERHWIRSFLLASEVALSVVLLVGAGLMIRGFRTLVGGKTSIEPGTVLTLRLEMNDTGHRTPAQVTAFYRQVLDHIDTLPGVQSAAAVSAIPYSRHARFSGVTIHGRESQSGSKLSAQVQTVSLDYFRTLRIPLRAGRLLGDRDGPGSPLSAVISEEAARQWWPGEPDPIGKQIKLGDGTKAPWVTIVGVVGGVQASVMDRTPRPTLYVPYTQFPEQAMDIAIRCGRDPLKLAGPARSAIKAVNAEQPVTGIMSLETMRQNEMTGLTYAAVLMSTFGAIALALSCVGVYGMTAYLVSRQTHEIGIRTALGASPSRVLRTVFWKCSRPALGGIAVGLLLSLGLARLLAAVIWGVSATDPGTFSAMPLLLVLAAGCAIYIPARRAAKIDPILALRNE